VGVAAVLGGVAMHSMDDVARIGARSVDDVTRVGAVNGLDDAARNGAGHIDETARPPVHGVDYGPRKSRGMAPQPMMATDDGIRAEQVAEFTADVAFEFVPTEFESDAATPTSFVENVYRPKYVDLTTEPTTWARLTEAGEDAYRAPWIFNARTRDDAVLVGSQAIPLDELAAACWQVGTTCIVVGCNDDDCSSATRGVFDRSESRASDRVDVYAAKLVEARIDTFPQPVFIVTVGGSPKREFTLVRPESHGSSSR
jgi:hypothetical protein